VTHKRPDPKKPEGYDNHWLYTIGLATYWISGNMAEKLSWTPTKMIVDALYPASKISLNKKTFKDLLSLEPSQQLID